MAEQNIKFEYENPNNIEAEVPGAQKIRGVNENGEFQITSENSKDVVTPSDLKNDERNRKPHSIKNGEDKNDEKKSKTRIPVSKFKQTVEKVKAERRGSLKEAETQIPIRRSSIPKLKTKTPTKPIRKALTITKTEVNKPVEEPVAAPEEEFDKLYEEVVCGTPTPVNIDVSLLNPKVDDPEKLESKFEEIIHDYDDNKVKPIDVETIRKSKIPFLKRKSQQEIEVLGDRSSKIIAARDKVRLRHSSSKSEEYNDGKDKKSDETVKAKTAKADNDQLIKNPTKTKTEVTSQYTKTINRTTAKDITSSVEQNDGKDIKSEETITDVKEIDNKLNDKGGSIAQTELTSHHTKTIIRTSSNDIKEENDTNVVTTATEVITNGISSKIENNKSVIIEENLHKEYIKIGIPVFDSYVDENIEKSEVEKKFEVETEHSYITNNSDEIVTTIETIEINNKPIITEVVNIEPTVVEVIDTSENQADNIKPETVFIEKQEETEESKATIKEKDGSVDDTANLSGKVNRLIIKIDSQEPSDKEVRNVNSNKELPKRKSVMSKIAIFEHNDEPVKSKIHQIDTKLPKLVTNNTLKIEHVHVHTPLIVEEVFKPFQAILDPHNEANKDVVATNGDERNVTQIIREEMVIIESPETVRYDVENKVHIESNTLSIEESKVTEEVLTPVPRQYELKDETVKDVNDNREILRDKKSVDAPIIIPQFIPVREVLKKYEYLNSHNENHVNNKIINLPKTRPISKIISDLNPEINHKYLDDTSHQVQPITKIVENSQLEDNQTDVIENQVSPNEADEKTVIENEVYQNDITKPVYKCYKSKGHEFTRFESVDGFKSLEFIQNYHDTKVKRDDMKRAKSLAELDIGEAVRGKVNRMIVRINSIDKIDSDFKESTINIKERPRKRSVSEKIALFESKLSYAKEGTPTRIPKHDITLTSTPKQSEELTADIQAKITELTNVKLKYGKMEGMPRIQLANGVMMPLIAVGTALLDSRLAYHIVSAAITMGYRAIDTAYIYGNERVVGEAIRDKINDGTVTREELFIISKLWSTFHRTDLVKGACEASLQTMGLDYFDLYLIHNPMSFKEGGAPIPKIATVIQYSESDYLDAWFGMETLGSMARAIGVSNFNSVQIRRVLDRARVKPVVNQVECHPYLSQMRLDNFCSERNITLSCFGVLGSKGTPVEFKSGPSAVIDDALVQVMASGLNVTPAQLLIRYQIECGHSVVVKASSAAHLWDNLQALTFNLTSGQVDALSALNRNKRTFTFKGMGDTHKNYPFNTAF